MRQLTNSRNPVQRGALTFGTWLYMAIGGGFANAAEPAQSARYVIEQPSQKMAEALRSIARQTSTSVLFDPDAVAGRVARPVSGRLAPIEAISAALQGTGLIAELKADGGIVVKPAPPAASLPASPASSGPVMVPTSGRRTDAEAQEQVRAVAISNDGETPGPDASRGPTELTRVEVTGSRLRRVDAEGPAPVNVYTRVDIARSGQPNLQRFLASLNEVSASAGEGGFSSTLGQGTVQLRGMPLGSTLVLINGRKLQGVGSSTGNVFNLNLIPAAAIERVEVVPQGSSAVYGGDALAGVVNVILKRSIDGQSFTASAGAGRGFDDSSVSMATGGQGPEGQFLLIGSYSRSLPLSMQERDFFLDADFRRFGGNDARRTYCTPGTVRSLSGNLPGLNASVAGIPKSAGGQTLKVSDFQSTAGAPNLCNLYTTGVGMPLLYGYKTLSVHALGERKLFGSWSAFTEISHVRDRMAAAERGFLLDGITVPAANPFNPFGVNVAVTAALGSENGLQGLSRQTNFTRALVGAKGELWGGWDAEATLSTASDRGGSQTWNANLNSTALASALASTDPATSFNAFATGRAASDAVLHQIWTDAVRRSVGRKDQLTAQVRGALVELPAGPVEAVFGLEAANDDYDVSTTAETHGKRSSSAVYGEARAPLLRSSNEAGARWDLAALTIAGRRDHYSDFGSANTFQGGLELRPMRSLLIRASAATSFKPPTILQTHTPDTVFSATGANLVDPARAGELIASGTIVRGTNPALVPEHGRARGIGAVWEPEGQPGARVAVTHWQMRIRDMIGLLSAQSVLNAETLFPALVTRQPVVNGQPGIVASILSTEVNFGRLETSGTDLEAAYGWKTAFGRLTVAGSVTRTGEYSVQLAPGAALVDRLGRRFSDYWAPRWKGRLAFGIEEGAWSLGLTSRYLGGYFDTGTSTRRLGDYWMHDLAGTLDLKKMWPGLLPRFKTASIGASVANLANREPQFAQGAPYYDVTQADWRGRYTTVRLTLDW